MKNIFEKFSFEERLEYIKKYGSIFNSYCNLQENISYFDIPNNGFISYYSFKCFFEEINIVFTRPVCSEKKMPEIIEYFLKQTEKKCIFWEMDLFTANILQSLGYYTNECGVSCHISLQDFSLRGKKAQNLRTAINGSLKANIEVKELPWSEIDEEEIKKISDEWIHTKKGQKKELRLTTRPPQFKEELNVRKFYCFKENKCIGYIFFDPFFKENKCIGYSVNIIRSKPNILPHGVCDFTLITALNKFKEEGVKYLSLGGAPLYNIAQHEGDNKILRYLFSVISNKNSSLFNNKSLAFHKMRYSPQEIKKYYLCVKNINEFKAILLILKSANVI